MRSRSYFVGYLIGDLAALWVGVALWEEVGVAGVLGYFALRNVGNALALVKGGAP